MIITKDMLDKKVPLDMKPTRLDSAIDLYTNTRNGLILYNIKPHTWNVLYPFFQQENKFTLDNYEIKGNNITFRELIDLYNMEYNTEYVLKKVLMKKKEKKFLLMNLIRLLM